MDTIYATFRTGHVRLLADLRRRLAEAPADQRNIWRRRLRAAQKAAKRFREAAR